MNLIKQKITKQTIVYISLVLFVVISLSSFAVAAQDVIARSYKTTAPLPAGSLVSTGYQNNNIVEAANQTNAESLVGVSTQSESSLVSVVETSDNVEVAISGTVLTMVSNINGDIKKGDKVAVSPISGVGMKADGKSKIIGLANQDFNSATSQNLTTQKITDTQGNIKDVLVGSILIAVSVGDDPDSQNKDTNVDNTKTGVLGSIRALADSVAGRPVSTTQIVLSFFVAIVAVVTAAVLVYGAIKNGVQATGRNPLAKPAIFEAMAQVLLMVVVICLATVLGIALILR